MKILESLVRMQERVVAWIDRNGVVVKWIFLLRVPVMASLVVFGLPYAVLMQSGPSALIEGAYEAQGAIGFGLLVMALSFLVGCFFATTEVICECAPVRFEMGQADKGPPGWLILLVRILYLAGPCCTLLVCLKMAFSGGLKEVASTKWVGYVAAAAVGVGVPAFLHLWSYRWTATGGSSRPVKFLLKVFAAMGKGYQGPARVAPQRRSMPSNPDFLGLMHVRLMGFALLSMLAFLGLAVPDCAKCPAALYVLLTVLAGSWILTGLAFFWDRFRMPLFTITLVWVMWVSKLWRSDYTFPTQLVPNQKEVPEALPDAGQVLGLPSPILKAGDPPYLGLRRGPGTAPSHSLGPVGVAAVGGGIHSGAWAVEVLTRIQELDGCASFPDRISALSGTSGGSYGTMFYAHAMYPYRRDRELDREKIGKLREVVRSSSLSAVVRKLTYHDLAGYWLPVPGTGDRGTEMENAWVRNAEQVWGRFDSNTNPGGGTDLDREIQKPFAEQNLWDWTGELRAGKMPAVFFTSGTEESGRPIVFGTSRVFDWNFNAKQTGVMERAASPAPAGGYDFHTVRVATGARLSATFPWVSPAARPEMTDGSPLRRYEHQLDGGYYDNFGLLALNRWMDEGLNAALPPRKRPEGSSATVPSDCELAWVEDGAVRHVLFIQIRYLTPFEEPVSSPKGFASQLTAPLVGLYHARVAGQRLRADEQFQLFANYWKLRNVIVDNVVFEYGAGAPAHTRKIREAGPEDYVGKLVDLGRDDGGKAVPEGDAKALRNQEAKQEEKQDTKVEAKQEPQADMRQKKEPKKPEAGVEEDPVSSPLSWHLTTGNKLDITSQGDEIQAQHDLYLVLEKAIGDDRRFSPAGRDAALARLVVDLPLGAAAVRVQRFISGHP
ncbi:hypothetical protein [Luteolibacter sp. LG18]|uniref:hypothetical protein n=1 Tax=Luteolibacter sp. LG18 TaxID=2819286 RepID=UPI0030C6ECBB